MLGWQPFSKFISWLKCCSEKLQSNRNHNILKQLFVFVWISAFFPTSLVSTCMPWEINITMKSFSVQLAEQAVYEWVRGGLDRGWWAPFIILSIGSIHRLRLRAFCIKEAGGRRGAPTLFSILGVPKKFSRGNISMFDNYFFQLNDCLIWFLCLNSFGCETLHPGLFSPFCHRCWMLIHRNREKNSNMIYSKKM